MGRDRLTPWEETGADEQDRWRRTARAAIAAYEAALWNFDIAQTPRDGSQFLVWDGLGVVNAIYESDPTLEDFLAICEEGEGEAEYREWLEDDNFGRGFMSHDPWGGDEISIAPLAFRPLPSPPESAK